MGFEAMQCCSGSQGAHGVMLGSSMTRQGAGRQDRATLCLQEAG